MTRDEKTVFWILVLVGLFASLTYSTLNSLSQDEKPRITQPTAALTPPTSAAVATWRQGSFDCVVREVQAGDWRSVLVTTCTNDLGGAVSVAMSNMEYEVR